MAKQKYLVVSNEKNNRGCYEIYGWCRKKIRGTYYLEDRPIRVITQEMYLKDFADWDLPISLEHSNNIMKDKNMEIEV